MEDSPRAKTTRAVFKSKPFLCVNGSHLCAVQTALILFKITVSVSETTVLMLKVGEI